MTEKSDIKIKNIYKKWFKKPMSHRHIRRIGRIINMEHAKCVNNVCKNVSHI